MDYYDVTFYFWGIATAFAMIFFFTLIRIGARAGVAIADQSTLVAGPIGTPIAEFIAPDSLEYLTRLRSTMSGTWMNAKI
jgi:hypothetical protein